MPVHITSYTSQESVNDASRIVIDYFRETQIQIVAILTADSIGGIYNHNMFMAQGYWYAPV